MKSKDDPALRCSDCLTLHIVICDGTVPDEHLVEGVVIKSHPCRRRLCARHHIAADGRDLCSRCAEREKSP